MCVLEEFPSRGPFLSGSREKVLCHKEGKRQEETDTRCSTGEVEFSAGLQGQVPEVTPARQAWKATSPRGSGGWSPRRAGWGGIAPFVGELQPSTLPPSPGHTGDLGGQQVDSLGPQV